MANISTAEGTATVNNLKGCTQREFWEAIYCLTEGWDYGFGYLDPSEFDSDCVDFSGSGRWTFSNSMEHLAESLQYAGACDHATEKDKAALEVLTKTSWDLEVEYTDVEPGGCVCYEEADIIRHDANTPVDKAVFSTIEEGCYDYSFYNIVEFLNYSIEDAYENFFWMEEDEEEFDELISAVKNYGGRKELVDAIVNYLEGVKEKLTA